MVEGGPLDGGRFVPGRQHARDEGAAFASADGYAEDMNLREVRQLAGSRQAGSDVQATFGAQYQTPDGATVIPVANPVGVFVVKDGTPTWKAATDDTRIALFGIGVGMVATIFAGIAMVLRPPWPDLRGQVATRG